MLPSSNGNVWPEGEEADAVSASWSTTTTDAGPSAAETCKAHREITASSSSSSSSFKSMLESDWFINNTFTPLPTQDSFKPFISTDLAFSSSPSFLTDVYSQSQPSSSSFFPPNSCMSSLFSAICSDPFDQNGYFDSNNANLFLPNNPICTSSNSDLSGFLGIPELNLPEGLQGFENGVVFPNRFNNMGLRPLEVLPIDGLQQQLQQQQQLRPTLFEKRAALRQNSVAAAVAAAAAGADKCVGLEEEREGDGLKLEKKKKRDRVCDSEAEQEDVDDVSCLNYDSDEAKLNNNVDRPNGRNDNDGADENLKGKKKGPPAKNLMAERRRRKKLNDRLYMLRSIVPKISKMDRASILGDAIEYLKELLQRINDLHQELEATPPGSLTQQTSNFQPLTPTLPNLPCRVKEECPSSLPSPKNNQPARVEVRLREGRAVNIHMFCARRPGLLLSTISALDNLGLDIQQAVISCFNGFALDVFRAEQCSEGQDVLPEQVKAVLLDSAGYHGVM